jgi:hypothetical protein
MIDVKLYEVDVLISTHDKELLNELFLRYYDKPYSIDSVAQLDCELLTLPLEKPLKISGFDGLIQLTLEGLS